MPPQIKQDLNRSGWETTDFPSICEQCLPDNPYVQMLKDDYGAECSICTRPYTLFTWKTDRTARPKKTTICLTCARLKNCCQSCMLDLSFGLPLAVRDAALNMIAPGPQSDVNKQFYAQEHEKEIEEGRGAIEEAYSKTDEKARELLRRLANSEPYYKKQRRLDAEKESDGQNASSTKSIGWTDGKETRDSGSTAVSTSSGPGPVRTSDDRASRRPGPYSRRPPIKGQTATKPPSKADILPPSDPNITSLFVTGVEDDLAEHEIRKFFSPFGALRSLICSHRAHCAFINYNTRGGAEAAAAACQGRAVIRGCPLRVTWGKPKLLDSMDDNERMKNAQQGRDLQKVLKAEQRGDTGENGSRAPRDIAKIAKPALPPGQEDYQYASLKGD